MVDRPMPIVNDCIHGGLWNRFPRLKMFLDRHRGNTNDGTSSDQIPSQVKRKESPGAMVRYDGRLATPSACAWIVRRFQSFHTENVQWHTAFVFCGTHMAEPRGPNSLRL